jgi:HEAT repeat protein
VQCPPDATYQDQLVWALRHPLPDRRLMAVTALGTTGDDRVASRLRELVYDRDPYLAAAALRSFATIVGLRSRGLLIEAAATGPAAVRYAARELLGKQGDALDRDDPRSA